MQSTIVKFTRTLTAQSWEKSIIIFTVKAITHIQPKREQLQGSGSAESEIEHKCRTVECRLNHPKAYILQPPHIFIERIPKNNMASASHPTIPPFLQERKRRASATGCALREQQTEVLAVIAKVTRKQCQTINR